MVFLGSLISLKVSNTDKKTYRAKLILQSVSDYASTDMFYLLEILPLKGKVDVLKEMKKQDFFKIYGSTINQFGKKVFFMGPKNNEKRVFYYRDGHLDKPFNSFPISFDLYKYGVLDTKNGKVTQLNLTDFGTNVSLENNNIYYQTINEGKIDFLKMTIDNLDKSKLIADLNKRAIVFLKDDHYLYFGNTITKVNKKNKTEINIPRKGNVLQAGKINDEWGYFCSNKIKHTRASLHFIRFEDMKVVKTNYKIPGCKLIAVLE